MLVTCNSSVSVSPTVTMIFHFAGESAAAGFFRQPQPHLHPAVRPGAGGRQMPVRQARKPMRRPAGMRAEPGKTNGHAARIGWSGANRLAALMNNRGGSPVFWKPVTCAPCR